MCVNDETIIIIITREFIRIMSPVPIKSHKVSTNDKAIIIEIKVVCLIRLLHRKDSSTITIVLIIFNFKEKMLFNCQL